MAKLEKRISEIYQPPPNSHTNLTKRLPSVGLVVRRSGIPVEDWYLHVKTINEVILSRFSDLGRLRSGLYVGKIHHDSPFHGFPYIRWHWIEFSESLIIDPCYWVLAMTRPQITINSYENYDLDHKKARKLKPYVPPIPDVLSPVVSLNLEGDVGGRIRELLLGYELTHYNQLAWLAELPPVMFGEFYSAFVFTCAVAGYGQLFAHRDIRTAFREFFPDDDLETINARISAVLRSAKADTCAEEDN